MRWETWRSGNEGESEEAGVLEFIIEGWRSTQNCSLLWRFHCLLVDSDSVA